MFEGLPEVFSQMKQQKPQSNSCFFCRKEKGNMEFYFFSDVKLAEEKLTRAIDIIYSSILKGRGAAETASKVFEACVPTSDYGAIEIQNYDNGKTWKVVINTNPLAF